MMNAPSSSALAKNGRNFGSDNSWPSLAPAKLDDAFIGDPVGLFGYFRIDGIVALARRRGHDLDVNSHPVQVEQPSIDRGHDLADVLVLLRIDFLGGSIGKMREWNAAEIDMRLGELGGLRNHDVSVDIDGYR
jgi:hypothetical protein